MLDFDAEAFVTELDRMGVKLTAIPLADGKWRVNRWCMLNATEYAQQIENLWITQIGNDRDRIDVLAAHLTRTAGAEGRGGSAPVSSAIEATAESRAAASAPAPP
jgi:hypothetical protein